MSWYDFYHEPTQRREVEGGIKALSRRGSFGTTWWGTRWIETLEGFPIGARLGRGKSYARSGQVLSIDIEGGRVVSRVQGSREAPYDVVIGLREYEVADWEPVEEAMSVQPYFVARLLAGEMPPGFEQLCAAEGLSLFPEREADLETDCSCPDWSNPCKHIAAVYYLLAEEFDRDPFLLLRLRGRTREDLLTRIVGESADERPPEPAETSFLPEPIVPDTRFWQAGPLPSDLFGAVRTPPAPAALLKRLGKFPFWRAEEPLLDALEPAYREAAPRGRHVFQGDDAA